MYLLYFCSNSLHVDGGQQLVHHHGELSAYFTTYHLLCNSVFHLLPSHSCRRGLHLKCQINGVQEYISSHFILSHWLVLGTFMRAFSFKFIQFVVEKHYKKILGSGKKKFYKLHSAISNAE